MAYAARLMPACFFRVSSSSLADRTLAHSSHETLLSAYTADSNSRPSCLPRAAPCSLYISTRHGANLVPLSRLRLPGPPDSHTPSIPSSLPFALPRSTRGHPPLRPSVRAGLPACRMRAVAFGCVFRASSSAHSVPE
ncbi:hypothetical protein B0H17DRAFT_1197205 [Mycena rosella]|uniref:Uncharacterized protein n=1 Tax=Mycena rosella TaxID=1033263 RepID=A0AAD7DRT9_MYCRO|nr:hypothetical protein B0H17DRAFT_1197205 [Mycena rosella]